MTSHHIYAPRPGHFKKVEHCFHPNSLLCPETLQSTEIILSKTHEMTSPTGACHYNFPLLPLSREPGYACGCRGFRRALTPRLPNPARLDVVPTPSDEECQCEHAACFHDMLPGAPPTTIRYNLFTTPDRPIETLSPRRLGQSLHAHRARIGRLAGFGTLVDREEEESPLNRQLVAATTSPKRKLGSVAGSSDWDSFGDTEEELAVDTSFAGAANHSELSAVSDDGSNRRHRRKTRQTKPYSRKLAGFQSSGCGPPLDTVKDEDPDNSPGGPEGDIDFVEPNAPTA